MKKILFAFFMMMNLASHAQTTYDISKDAENNEVVFNGPLTFNDLNKEQSFTWLKNGYAEFKPNEKAGEYLRAHLNEYTMVVFLGTWCDDSHELVPKLAKLLDYVGYNKGQITMYGVDRQKKTKNGEEKKYNVTLVPTIILFKDGKEAGRITESVQKGLEADLVAIIKR